MPWSSEADGALSSDRVDGPFHQPAHRLNEHRAHALLHRLLDAAHRLIDGGALLPQLAVPTNPAERVSGACLGCSLFESSEGSSRHSAHSSLSWAVTKLAQ